MDKGKEILILKTEQVILEQLKGKPYPEQLKLLLKIVRDAKKSEGISIDVLQMAENSERALMRELNIVHADLN